jgi:hypothetical protein
MVYLTRSTDASQGGHLRHALAAYVSALPPDASTQVDPEVDLTNAQPNQRLPIVPDVALQYRCGDNIGFSYMYGILVRLVCGENTLIELHKSRLFIMIPYPNLVFSPRTYANYFSF